MANQLYGVCLYLLLTCITKSKSFLIPFVIYDAAKNGWFQATFGGQDYSTTPSYYIPEKPTTRHPYYRPNPPTEPPVSSTTSRTTTTEEPSSVEYSVGYNPCGYGPKPAFNPRERSSDDNVPYISEIQRYQYTSNDIGNNGGNNKMDSFLLNALQNMKNPNFYANSAFFNWDDLPKYDHYKIHRFRFNAHKIPTKVSVDSHQIMDCTADSRALCPKPTMSVCTSNGGIICVANRSSVVPCRFSDYEDCVNVKLLDKSNPNDTKTILEKVPCFSNLRFNGDIGFIETDKDTTIVYKNKFMDEMEQTWANIKWNSDLSHPPRRLNERHYHPFQEKMDEMQNKLKEVEEFDIYKAVGVANIHYDPGLFCTILVALPGKPMTKSPKKYTY